MKAASSKSAQTSLFSGRDLPAFSGDSLEPGLVPGLVPAVAAVNFLKVANGDPTLP